MTTDEARRIISDLQSIRAFLMGALNNIHQRQPLVARGAVKDAVILLDHQISKLHKEVAA